MLKELSDAARWIAETGQRLVVLFEGRDTAGKGGSIHMFAATLNPRQCHVVALAAPSERRTRPMVFPALRRPLSRQRRNRLVRPQLVQPRRGRAGDGLLHAKPRPTPSSPPRRSSNGNWSTRACCCSNIGCAATRTSRRSASPSASTTRCAAGNCRRSISRRASKYRRLHRGPRADAGRDAYRLRAVDAGRFQRPAARPPDPAARPARPPARHQTAAAPTSHWPDARRDRPSKERYGVLDPIAAFDIARAPRQATDYEDWI